MVGHYDPPLVVLSVLIAIIASYVALDLAGRVKSAPEGRGWLGWVSGGSIVMGLGIWAMHYVGMDAFQLPVPVLYDWPTVLASLVAAIVFSWVALFLASRSSVGSLRMALGSVAMGIGISEMHYIGMEAMRLPAKCEYSTTRVALSVLLAVVISFVALRLAVTIKSQSRMWSWSKAGVAALMGLAISSMHYVGMSSATFVPAPLTADRLVRAVSVSQLGLTFIVIVTLTLLMLALLASTIDRKASLQALELIRSRRQLDSVFDAMSEAIVIQDSQRNVIQLNRAASQLLGMAALPHAHTESEATFELLTLDGKTIPTEDWPGARALNGQFCHDVEVVIKNRKSGTSFFAEISSVPVSNVAGDARQIMTTVRDVTERKQMDATRALFAAIVESSEDGIIAKDAKGYVTSWNAGAEKIFGYTAAEMVGQSIKLVVPAEREAEEDEFLARIVKGEIVHHVETIRKRKDGVIIHVSVTISPIRNQWGKIVGASKIVRDITDRRKMERQLAQSQKMDAVGQLTGGISHDFNNLLGVIIGNLDLLERLIRGNEPANERLQIVRKAANRGADLTRRLLSFASSEELRPSATHLQHTIRNVLELAGRAIGPGIKIATQFDPQLTSVFVDASSCESALLNLVVNARDAMPKGGVLTISTQLVDLEESYPPVQAGEMKAGHYARISFSDTGIGMPRAVQERAFEPFFTTKPRSRGTGLGLAMVYGFAKQSGGTARIYSEVGVGTTVSIYLPVAISEEPSHLVSGTRKSYARPEGTVLVVDDEPDLLEIAVVYLKDLGYDALAAHDGKSALELIERRRDIILMITDIVMTGDMNGVELARMAHVVNPSLKIIYSSGFPAGALQEGSMLLVDGPLLRKPYRPSEFQSAITAIMIPTGLTLE